LLAILFLVTTSNYFDYFILSVLLDPIKNEFGVSDTLLGLLSGVCFSALYAVAALPIARWADRGNRRTVIVWALTAWSTLTAICGLAQSFWQLAALRLGVGAVEPGAVPPAQSLLADYFPPERRASALALLTQGGSAAGWLFGVVIGGYIAAEYGWRMAFVLAGAPGLLLAMVARVFLAEPRRSLGFPAAGPLRETLTETCRRLRHKHSFLFASVGLAIYGIFGFGIAIFLPSFMIRTLHVTLEQVSLSWGLAISAANLLGALAGGWLADRLSPRDVRCYGWIAAGGCAASIPLYGLALACERMSTFIAVDFLAEASLAIGLPASFAAVHAVCGNQRRVMAIAIMLFTFTLVGSGLGPLIAGALSDAYTPAVGRASLQYSLFTMIGFLIPATVLFLLCARALPGELES